MKNWRHKSSNNVLETGKTDEQILANLANLRSMTPSREKSLEGTQFKPQDPRMLSN